MDDIQVLRHELCHAFCNLYWGAESVAIKESSCGKFYEAIPCWPEALVADEVAIYRAGVAGLLAGRIYGMNVGIRTDYDESQLQTVPESLIAELWPQVVELVEPVALEITDSELSSMLAVISTVGAIEIRRDGMLQ
jgi:hypothetical protein